MEPTIMGKKNEILDSSGESTKAFDRISVLEIEKLSALPARFKNTVLFDFLSTYLEESKYGTPDFTEHARAAKYMIEALAPQDSKQLLLASQISSMHKAHHKMLMLATNEQRIDQIQTFMNLAIKISNIVTQQIQLMQKLKDGNQQKVVIEHVSINGGQAVVGTINTSSTPHERKK